MSEKHDPVWEALGALRDSEVVREARAYAEARAARRSWFSTGRRALATLIPATGLAAALAVIALFLLLPGTQRYSSAVGEIRRVELSDGSVALLNSGSTLEVRYGLTSRAVALVTGEARFDVAHDRSRPFRVTAGGMTVTALGTAFDVVALPSRTGVTLIQGRVLVEAGRDTPGTRSLLPGQQVRLRAGALTKPEAVPIDTVLAWQQRLIELNDQPLAEALAEVNRYSRIKLIVADPALQDARISGVFKTGDVDAVAAALRAYYGVTVVRRDREALVLDRAR